MAKVCFYHPERRCFWSCCSFVDEFGNVQVHDCVRSGFHRRKGVGR
jgi:hypothetical protein